MRSTIVLQVFSLGVLLSGAPAANFRGKYSQCRLERLGGLSASIKFLILPSGLFNNPELVPNYQNYISNFMLLTLNSNKSIELWDLTIDGAGGNMNAPQLYAIQTKDARYTKQTLASALQATAAFVYLNESYIAINEDWYRHITVQDGITKKNLPLESPRGTFLWISPRMNDVAIYTKNSTNAFTSCSFSHDKLSCVEKQIIKRQGSGTNTKGKPLFIVENSTPPFYFVIYDRGGYNIYYNLDDIMSNQTTEHQKEIQRAEVTLCTSTTIQSTTKRSEPSPWSWVTPIVVIILIFVICLSCIQYYR